MCVAIICHKSKPDEKMLFEAERQNQDGAGISWVEKGTVRFLKGLTAEEVKKEIKKLPLPLFIHFRLSTVGGKVKSLCHPFAVRQDGHNEIEGKSPFVLMHNGHWSEWKNTLALSVVNGNRKLAPGPWSDTRAMAYLAAHHGFAILELLTSDRIAVMTGKGKIYKYGYWHEKDGMEFSNYSLFSTPVPSHPFYQHGETKEAGYLAGMSKRQRKEADKIARRVQNGNEQRLLTQDVSPAFIPSEKRTPEQQRHVLTCKERVHLCPECCIIFGKVAPPAKEVHSLSKCYLTTEQCPECRKILAARNAPLVVSSGQPQTMAEALREINEDERNEALNKTGME